MIIYTLSALDKALIFSASGAVVLGIIIYFLCGIIYAPQDKVIIVEKFNHFYKTYEHGFHYGMPIIYRKVGTYYQGPQVNKIKTLNGNLLDITFEIKDFAKFHYAKVDIATYVQQIEKENSDITIAILQESFQEIGLHFINIKKAK